MTDTPEALWSTLHDGVITSIEGNLPGDLILAVEIAYLATRFSPNGKFLFVRLEKCSRFSYDFWLSENEIIHYSELEEIARQNPTIIAGTQEASSTIIECATGVIRCNYAGIELAIMGGRSIQYSELLAEAESYWNEWKATYT